MSFGWVGRVIANEFGRVWRSLTGALRLFYDNLGLSILISAFWYVFAFLPVQFFIELAAVAFNPFSVFLVILVSIVLAAPVTASAYAASAALISREGFYVRDLFLGIGRYWKKAAGTSTIASILLYVLIVDVIFFSQSPYSVLRWLTILFGYLIAFWVMGMQYLFPFIVQQDVGVRKTLKRAALVALDNVIVSFLLLLIGLVVTYFSIIPIVPMVLIYMGFMSAMHNYALIEILKKYDDPEPAETESTP